MIFVGGSVDDVPEALADAAAEGGRLVVVEGSGNAGVARLYVKSNGVVTGRSAFNAAVKPLPGFERAAQLSNSKQLLHLRMRVRHVALDFERHHW